MLIRFRKLWVPRRIVLIWESSARPFIRLVNLCFPCATKESDAMQRWLVVMLVQMQSSRVFCCAFVRRTSATIIRQWMRRHGVCAIWQDIRNWRIQCNISIKHCRLTLWALRDWGCFKNLKNGKRCNPAKRVGSNLKESLFMHRHVYAFKWWCLLETQIQINPELKCGET